MAAPSIPIEFQLTMGKAKPVNPADDSGKKAGAAINAFGFDLFRQLVRQGNLCFSPASIALAVAMVQPGARGETAAQMSKVLHNLYSTSNGPELIALLKAFAQKTLYQDADGNTVWLDPTTGKLTGTPAGPPIAQLNVANQAFAQRDLSLLPAYLDALSSDFGAGLGLLDFRSDPEAARQVINKWASDHTNGLIPEILQPGDLDETTLIELANAVYFKANWDEKFDPAATKSQPFYRANGSTVAVPTMYETTLLLYAQRSGYRAVNLPYVNGASMTIVVPNDMGSFVASLNQAKFAALFSPATAYIVHLYLPRFSVRTGFDAADILARMGMPDAFNSARADLSGIDGRRDIYLSHVIHQAVIDVNEEGTTAAAVTVVGGKGSAGSPPIATFHVDHPFLYFITDNASGTILFMGRVDDPIKGS